MDDRLLALVRLIRKLEKITQKIEYWKRHASLANEELERLQQKKDIVSDDIREKILEQLAEILEQLENN